MGYKTVILLLFILFYKVNICYSITLNVYYHINIYQKDNVIDKDKLESLKDDYDYSQNEYKANWWIDFKEWFSIQWQKFFGDINLNSFWLKLFDILPYIILVIAVVLIIWLIVHNNPGSQIMHQHKKSKVILSEEEELLMKRNLNKLAEEAILKKEYRFAVRYLYLNCIKGLDLKNIIRYTNDKTNYEYVNEIKSNETSKIFKSLTLYYEQIWYGQMVFDESYFKQFKNQYHEFEQNLEKQNYAKA